MNVVLDTLSYMSKLDRINDLVYKKIKPYLGKRILEAGCGNGNLTSFLLDRDLVIAVDNDEAMLEEAKKRFSQYRNIKFGKYDLADSGIKEVTAYDIDTIICVNTLEHIRDDGMVLDNFNSILKNGNLIIIAPAFKFLFCPLDKAAGHFRRYNLKELSAKVERCGFTVSRNMYANFFGIMGWFFNGKLLRRERLSKGLLSLFNFFIPLFELFEETVYLPAGLSIILVCRKNR